ncbi:MAG: patatin-like protein, partial [Bradyrhizobium sp.]|uniref:patatin-like protein n=1 Tax=Bradyrhizobium sp. TaxID=376 RepID=UPI001E031F65
MKEKELRIALVCFGGVSLAVYMHGISKEILKLVRASSALHSIADRDARASASFFDRADRADPEYDTDEIYFDLLHDIGRTLELRIVVDIVAGASAGGINGTMLARALAHDLPIGALRDLWLDNADISGLLAPRARARAGSKLVLKPVVWLLGATGLWESIRDREVRRNLSLFVRSRWFKPPLSGDRMAELMYDAAASMGQPKHPRASLLPSGQRLDLFVTVTDHYGHRQLVQIHDPPIIQEREHRHVLRFRYQRRPNGEVISDFVFENAAALAFAARATSSFPGAFPPAQISEMDAVLARKSVPWPKRDDFIARNFDAYTRLNIDPTSACFLDGSVLNNRPFREAISAIRGRPAYRQVDRRLIYIDPDPVMPGTQPRSELPGFFSTLKAALSDLPSAEPVRDELDWVNNFNDRITRLREIIDEARPHVSRLVADIGPASFDQPITPEQVRAWRERVNVQVAADAGFAYEAYVRLKLASVRSFVAGLIAALRRVPAHSPFARAITVIIDAWAIATDTIYRQDGQQAVHLEAAASAQQAPRWVKFLLAFDVDYRKRRLHFMIEGQNRLYQAIDRAHFQDFDRATVDRLKRDFYDCLDILNRREDITAFKPATRDLVETLFATAPDISEAEDLESYARQFVARHRERIDLLVDQLATQIDLNASTDDVDKLLVSTDPKQWHPNARREVLVNYLGFPFWDVLTFPFMRWREVGEFNKILVDRISPQDALALKEFGAGGRLKGVGFGHFAAFFSRAYREHDYLLGRIHALDRLIDIVCNSARLDMDCERDAIMALKQRGFTRILDAEEPHLPNSSALIAAL